MSNFLRQLMNNFSQFRSDEDENDEPPEPALNDSASIYVEEPQELSEYEFITYDGEKQEYAFTGDVDGDKELLAGRWVREVMERDDAYVYLGTYSSDIDKQPNLARVKIDSDLIRHMALFGETGSGKTTLSRNIMVQLAERGYGFCYIDPKKAERDENGIPQGDATELIRQLPRHRHDDIVYITPEEIDGYSYNVNLLETPAGIGEDDPEFESVIDFQLNYLENLMRISLPNAMWGPQMGNIYESLSNPMIRSDSEYRMGDLQYLIHNPNDIERFIERYEEESEDDYQTELLSDLSELDDQSYNSLKRRTNQFVHNRDVRNLVFGDSSDIDFREIVRENKIVIVDINQEVGSGLNIQKILMGYLINMLYLATTSVANEKEFFMFSDEFDAVLKNDLVPIIPILKRGRSQNFVLSMATQTPSTLDTDGAVVEDANVLTESQTNVNLVATGNVDDGEARTIESLYTSNPASSTDLGTDDLANPSMFHFWVQAPDSKSESAYGTEVGGFPPYPPRISRQQLRDIVRESVMEYGTPHEELIRYEDGVRDFLKESDSGLMLDKGMSVVDIATKFDEEHKDVPDEFATSETIKQIIDATGMADLDKFNIEEWLERQTGLDRLTAEKQSDTALYKLEKDGREQLEIGTGSSGSAGSQSHRILTQEIRDVLADHGIYVSLPTQAGSDEQPDAYGYVFSDVDSRPFKERLSVGDEFIIEIEKSTTDDRPSRMLRNLRKAFEKDTFVVFATDQKPPEKAGSTERYKKIEQIIEEQEFVRSEDEHGKRLYNSKTLAKDGMYPIRKLPDPSQANTRSSKWYIDGEYLHLMERDSSGNTVPITSWSPVEGFQDWSIDQFQAYAERTDNGRFKVHDLEEDTVLDPVDDVNDDTDVYRTVNKPWIPSIELGGTPDKSDYSILVLPTRGRSLDEPHVYENGEFEQFTTSDEDGNDEADETEDDEDEERTFF